MVNDIVIDPLLNSSDKLYRYMSLSQFISFVENKELYLTQIKHWEDTWEIPTSSLPILTENNTLRERNGSFFNSLLGQCWTKNGNSDALWRIYSQDKQGIQIQTSVEKFRLLKYIKGLLAPISYYSEDNLLEKLKELESKDYKPGFLADGLLKRDSFDHEAEVRLISFNDSPFVRNYDLSKKFIYVEVHPLDFIEAITIDPRADDWYVETIKKYCTRAGFSIIPVKSDLYSSQVFEKTHIAGQWVKYEDQK